ncbi:MAG: hypothetical protein QRY72_04550 [Candidatus Rhabdochlamydia sp.]
MISILFMLLAGVLIALSNYLMRKSVDTGGTTKGFLVIQLAIVAVVATFLNPIRLGSYTLDLPTFSLAIVSGGVLSLMMFSLGRALEIGPAGLTFATLNAATVFPALILTALLGTAYGYTWSVSHTIGSLLVIVGLFWSGWSTFQTFDKPRWLRVVLLMFTLHICFLVILSIRAFFLTHSPQLLLTSFDRSDFCSAWFMPLAFCAAAIFQGVIFFTTEKRFFSPSELMYGILGGCANGIGTFFMIRATEVAQGNEQMILYPLLSVFVILLCNLWGQLLYQERINWKSTFLCLIGIVIAGVFA